jgi:hypothetical protein
MADRNEKGQGPFDGVEHVSDQQLGDWIARIQTGERSPEVHGLALEVIHDFCFRQGCGRTQSEVTLQWLADVLEGILEHRDPLELLGLPRRAKSRPPNPAAAFDVALWLWCAQSMRGYPHTEAVALAAERFGKDQKSIERIWTRCAHLIGEVNANAVVWEKYFLGMKPAKPLPLPRDIK